MSRHPQQTKPEEPLQVIYDSECFACRALAGFMKKKTSGNLLFLSRKQFLSLHPGIRQEEDQKAMDELWVLAPGGKILKGAEAWELLVNRFQSLKALNWLAEKAGLSGVPARSLRAAGHGLRSLCFRCKKDGLRKRSSRSKPLP